METCNKKLFLHRNAVCKQTLEEEYINLVKLWIHFYLFYFLQIFFIFYFILDFIDLVI